MVGSGLFRVTIIAPSVDRAREYACGYGVEIFRAELRSTAVGKLFYVVGFACRGQGDVLCEWLYKSRCEPFQFKEHRCSDGDLWYYGE